MAKAQAYFFEAPYQLAPPILTDEQVGIDRVLLRAQHCESATITVYDTTDKRLLHAGVQLSFRQVDESCEWMLRADGWEPWLPGELVVNENDGEELPAEIAELVAPFRRRAALGPVASWSSERARYALLDVDGKQLAELIDERIALSQGGPISERARQITLQPKSMTSAQRAFVIERLTATGADRVEDFQSPAQRLAEMVPASDLTQPLPKRSRVTLEEYVRWTLAQRLRGLLFKKFAIQQDLGGDPAILVDDFKGLQRDLAALDGLLEAGWMRDIGWHLEQAIDAEDRGVRKERAVDILDLLAAAVRAPRVDGDPQRRALDEIRSMLTAQLAGWLVLVDQLVADSPDDRWVAAVEALDQLLALLEVADPLLRKTTKWQRQLVAVAARLQQTVNTVEQPQPTRLAELSVDQAFAAGREYQRDISEVLRVRSEFIHAWPQLRSDVVSGAPDAKALRFALSAAKGPDSERQLAAGDSTSN